MKNRTIKLLSGILALTLSVSILASCGKKPSDSEAATDTTAESTGSADEVISLPDYDFTSLELSQYVKLPEDYNTRDYSAGLALKGEPTDKDISESIRVNYLSSLSKDKELGEDAVIEDLDTVIMDFTGKREGVAFEGGSATDYEHDISIENSTFIDGFDRGLIGMKVGETKDLDLTFPDPYPNNPDLAGKPVVFTVKITKIVRPEYPELTDALILKNAKVFGENIKSVDDLKKTVAEQLKDEFNSYNDNLKVEAAWKYLTENSVYTSLPSEMLEGYKATYLKSYEASAKQNGTTLEQYALSGGYLSLDDFKEKVINSAAEQLLKEKLLMYHAAKQLNISVTDEQAREAANNEFKAYIEPNIAYYTMAYGISDLESYINHMGGLTIYKENLIFSKIVTELCGLKTE